MQLEREGDRWLVTIAADWPGFAGHFPGDPLLPAAVLIDQARACAQAAGDPANVITRARFVQAVRPGDRLTWTQAGSRWQAHCDGELVAEVGFKRQEAC